MVKELEQRVCKIQGGHDVILTAASDCDRPEGSGVRHNIS